MVLNSIGLTISEVVDVPSSYVSVWFVESRRLEAVKRKLSARAFVLEYSIDVLADSDSDASDVNNVEASLDSVDVSSFTSLLQTNIDSSFGAGVYSVEVLVITAVVDVSGSTPVGSDEAGISPTAVIIFIFTGVGFCVGCQFPVMALCWRRRRRQDLRALSEESDQAQSGRAKRGGAVNRVQLPEALGPLPEEHYRANMARLRLGSTVELQGFPSSLNLNGHRGRVTEWMPDHSRYVIKLTDGERKSVLAQPINLVLMEGGPMVPPSIPCRLVMRGASAGGALVEADLGEIHSASVPPGHSSVHGLACCM